MVRFEYSKDFKTWVNKINDKSIEDFTVLGSYDVRQGYNLTEAPRASIFSMDIVSDYKLAKALVEYKYIRIYKDAELAFIGILSDESTRKIETLRQQVLSIKYVHLLSLLEDKPLSTVEDYELSVTARDKVPFLKPKGEYSLIQRLMNTLLSYFPSGLFTYENTYSIDTDVIDFQMKGTEKLWPTINDMLREYGYILRVENQTIRVVDILKDAAEGIELLDGADIHRQTKTTDMSLPHIKFMSTEEKKDVMLYNGSVNVSQFLWWGGEEGDVELDYQESDGVKMNSVRNLRYTVDNEDVVVENYSLSADRRTLHRKLSLTGSIEFIRTAEQVVADVTYAIYKEGIDLITVPEGIEISDAVIEPKYLYGEKYAERYARSLLRIKQFEQSEWTFYSKVKMAVDTIVRFKDIPDTTCRIFEVQDTLEADGGYTYRAFPFDANDITFKQVEENVNPGTLYNSITAIYPAEPIFVENGIYRKPRWRIYIQTANTFTKPTVNIEGVPFPVKYDGHVTRYYIEVALSDTNLDSFIVTAKVDFSEESEAIPIYKITDRVAIIEYKYSTSAEDPNADDMLLAYGEYALKFKDYFIGYVSEPWSKQIPTGDKYANMYLWKRTWNYDLNDWVCELLTPVIKVFELECQPSTYIINKRNINGSTLIVKAIVKHMPGDVEVVASGGILTPAAGIKNQWNLYIGPTVRADKITLTATLGLEQRTLELQGIFADESPIYNGILGVPPAPDGLIKGDFYLTTEGIPKRWNGTSWEEPTKDDDNYIAIMEEVGKDWLVNGNDITEVTAAMYGYFGVIYSATVLSDNVIARNLEVGDGKPFLFKVADREKGNPIPAVFEVKYGPKTIFQIVPSTGRIFMGQPNKDLDAPLTGFMYDPDKDTISTKGKSFLLSAEGDIVLNDTQLNGSFNCASIFTDKAETIPVPYYSSENTNRQIEAFYNQNIGAFGETFVQCRLSAGNPAIKFCKLSKTEVGGGFTAATIWELEFFDIQKNPCAMNIPTTTDAPDRPTGSNTLETWNSRLGGYSGKWAINGFAVEVMTGGNILRLDIPVGPSEAEIATYPYGQMYALADGTVKMATKR